MSEPPATPQLPNEPGESRWRALRNAFLAERGVQAPPGGVVTGAELRQLRAGFRGPVFRPGDDG